MSNFAKANSDILNPSANKANPPLSQAIIVALLFAAFFIWLKAPRETERLLLSTGRFVSLNELPLAIALFVFGFDLIWLATAISSRFINPSKVKEIAKETSDGDGGFARQFAVWLSLVGITGAVSWLCSDRLSLRGIHLLPFHLAPNEWQWFLSGLLFTALMIVSTWIVKLINSVSTASFTWPWSPTLPKLISIQDGIVLGAIHEDEAESKFWKRPPTEFKPSWVYFGLKALTGNIFITGVIGTGKSQALLQLLKQCLSNLTQTPSMLAIDPKRTFVRELRKIIEALGMSERLLWVSLELPGETASKHLVRFNPIWRENLIKDSGFTAVANSLRLASVNFLGSSSDNRFWEQSSFNLLKCALIYCAAKYEYYTFKELYRALVLARDEGLAADLVDCLNSEKRIKDWDVEERANITMAITYFNEEFAQMDEKIRTSILATATSFLNEFLEYRVSRVLSPERDEINLPSMAQAIREGKLICMHIENNALARSVGTLLKLLYQEAVLARVSDTDHAESAHAILVMDEYQDVATSGGGAGLGDDRFLAMARESKAITIAATQSVSSLENAIRNEPATREILQNFRTRIFGNSTDPKTIRIFQDPQGQIEIERTSKSFSESTREQKGFSFLGGQNSDQKNVSESVSTHLAMEYPVTAKEFSRLRAFEAFAQIFDGLDTTFEKLYIKPHYLKNLRTPHSKVLAGLRKAAKVPGIKSIIAAILLSTFQVNAGASFPNVCSVIKSSDFTSCLDFKVGACMCGWPVPRPCAQISYYVPQTFVEVWPDSKDSFFAQHPAGAQLASHAVTSAIPFGVEDDNGTFSFQAHSIAVPMSNEMLAPLPCGGTRFDKPCFDLMSEDVGVDWRTGKADLLQPAFLAWQLSPKACLLKGAAQGLSGATEPSVGADSGGCSYPLKTPKYPPSTRDACNGWGVFYPRHGIYHGASRTGAALMIAARLKSIGTEVSRTVPGDMDEVWQMVFPQSSSCFKEGQNIGMLETIKGVREEARLTGKLKGYLFVVWKRVSCCRDIPEAPAALVAIQALRAACLAVPGGGI